MAEDSNSLHATPDETTSDSEMLSVKPEQRPGSRHSSPPTEISTRPTSSYTIDSVFTDSGVDMNATTPVTYNDAPSKSNADYFGEHAPPMPDQVDQSMSDKLRQLAAIAWTMEQDDGVTVNKRAKVLDVLQDLEKSLDNVGDDPAAPKEEEDEDEEWIDEADLIAVRQSLAATVQAMRMRQEEQHHLHQLTAQKLESVAQRCISQDQQIQDLFKESNDLRKQNHDLEAENEALKDEIARLRSDSMKKEVAVNAMSSAVAGLEGFIDHTSRTHTPTRPPRSRKERVVVRGRGRFRGRYVVNDDWDHPMFDNEAEGPSEGQELQEGVKAWLRGFRDVEEELRSSDTPSRFQHSPHTSIYSQLDDNDWGDFESPHR